MFYDGPYRFPFPFLPPNKGLTHHIKGQSVVRQTGAAHRHVALRSGTFGVCLLSEA